MINQAPKKAPWWNPAKWFAVRRTVPIEQRSYTKIYGIMSMLLFAFTVWAVLNEVITRRPWKDIQADFKDFKTTRLNIERKKELAKIDPAVRKQLKKDLAKAKDALESDKYTALKEKLDDMDIQVAKAQRDYTFTKSRADETYYFFDEERIQHKDTTSNAKTLRSLEAEMAKEKVVVDGLLVKRKLIVEQINPFQKTVKEKQAIYDSVFAGVIAIDRKLEAVDKMTIAVKQTMLLNYEKTNFNNLKMRVDRCETCHLSYADPLFKNDTIVSTDAKEVKAWLKSNKYNDEDHYKIKKLGANKDTVVAVVSALFRIHPNVDLMIKGHKVGEPSAPGVLGCTSCHSGQGQSIVSPEFAHGFESHWAEPMLTGHYVQASCQNCHDSKFDFEGAKWISMGKKLFVDFGCYGCHTMNGMEDWSGQGPSLLNVSKKVTPEWMFQWIKNPRGWSHNTRMPNFMFSDDDAKAVTAYVLNQSKGSNFAPIAHNSGGGDMARGKQTFFDAGCVACHSIDEYKADSRVKESNSFGPDLNKEGSKVTSEWLFDWLKNPKNYQAHSRMPSLRLTDQEASDLTTYVMSHTGSNDSVKSTLSGDITSNDLIKKGESLVRGYGCFGCHEIKGMEGEARVSVALTTFGRKTPGELSYGDVDGEVLGSWRKKFAKAGLELGQVDEHSVHDNQDWFTWTVGKMMNSRVYATDRLAQKMPNFQMGTEEAYALSVFLRSQKGAFVAAGYGDVKTDLIQNGLDKGRFFAHWNNCVGCHKIESGGGYVAKFVNDKFGGDQNIAYFAPPYLGPEGSRVQEQWLHQFLQGPFKIRPLVKMRMPSYGFSDVDISTATNYFLSMHKRPLVMTNYEYPVNNALVPYGKALVDKLKCVSCHSIGTQGADGAKSPNLLNVKKRMRPDWVGHWLARPDSIMPGTPMTGFWWSGGKPAPADPEILGGNITMQIEAVKEYLHSIGTDVVSSPSAYATINGVDKYVLPNGDYEGSMARAIMPNADMMLAKPATKTPAQAPPQKNAKQTMNTAKKNGKKNAAK